MSTQSVPHPRVPIGSLTPTWCPISTGPGWERGQLWTYLPSAVTIPGVRKAELPAGRAIHQRMGLAFRLNILNIIIAGQRRRRSSHYYPPTPDPLQSFPSELLHARLALRDTGVETVWLRQNTGRNGRKVCSRWLSWQRPVLF
ncbi:hypothetical protein DPEC_G00319150 [Dallia pectoralis]|uniref:Uncharacterized protein n=1 Tax=Dallia pectoralis TaxID=75939 RepID=A0ACC2F9I4_DALPE|nr:hypothetical protein DPEC_G00319150 [Dallia pectoralis]